MPISRNRKVGTSQPTVQDRLQSRSLGPSQAYSTWQAQQQAIAAQRAKAIADARRKQQEAQQRRFEAEQAARIAEFQRKQREQQILEASKARQESRRQAIIEREKYTIKKSDTVEGIASRFGASPQEITSQIKEQGAYRLRPGQTFEFAKPGKPQEAIALPALKVAQGILSGGRAERLAEFGKSLISDFAGKFAQAGQGFSTITQGQIGGIQEAVGGPQFDLTPWNPFAGAEAQGPTDTRDPAVVAQLNELNQTQQAYDLGKEQAHKLWMYTSYGIDHWLETGDDNLRPTIITGETFDHLTDEQKLLVRDYMGYEQDEEGDWRRIEFAQEGYGMGDYSFPGYDFGGGGGGNYEYLSRGGQMYRKEGGGKSRQVVKQMYEGGISPAHWRI